MHNNKYNTTYTAHTINTHITHSHMFPYKYSKGIDHSINIYCTSQTVTLFNILIEVGTNEYLNLLSLQMGALYRLPDGNSTFSELRM